MPTLPTRSFSTIVANTVAGIQGRASSLIDFGEGSPLRAIVEGFASLFLWFQALAFQILAAARLSTSTGSDVDTFVADFMPPVGDSNSPRLGPQIASGLLVFARETAGATTCFIPVGTTAETNYTPAQSVRVTADPALPTYSATLDGYTLVANVASITVPASAIGSGALGNVVAGTVTVMTSAVTGIDTVYNPASFTGGSDGESDPALKSRFKDWILGLSRGDLFGTNAAIEGAAVNVQFTVTEDYDYSGAWHPGFYFIVADDGSGAPPPAFMTAVTNAAWSVRPLGVELAVFPPVIVQATISLQISVAQGYDTNTVVGLVSNAIADGVNTLGLGNDLDFYEIPVWAYSVPGVKKVFNVRLNSLTGDAASLSASRQSLDGYKKMQVYTIKCSQCIVSPV